MKKISFLLIVLLGIITAGFRRDKIDGFGDIKKGFINPPDSIRISTFYYWLNNHTSKEGVIEDLRAMKKAGITRVFIGTNIRNRTSWSRDTTGMYFGNVKIFSDE